MRFHFLDFAWCCTRGLSVFWGTLGELLILSGAETKRSLPDAQKSHPEPRKATPCRSPQVNFRFQWRHGLAPHGHGHEHAESLATPSNRKRPCTFRRRHVVVFAWYSVVVLLHLFVNSWLNHFVCMCRLINCLNQLFIIFYAN